MTLEDLGDRICILGPSNSGKSTLAAAIACKRKLPAIHLDQLYHLPHTNWQPRPAAEFAALHDAVIMNERWVIEGNYSRLMPQRFARATGLILLDVSTMTSIVRYLRRTIFDRDRPGILEGGQDTINWKMIHHIVVVTPANRKRYAALYEQSSLAKIALLSAAAIKTCYVQWQV
jgi:adenylate kinase family enzyme